jgi:hypothetical protein
MNKTLLTADELAERIKFSAAYINHGLKNGSSRLSGEGRLDFQKKVF